MPEWKKIKAEYIRGGVSYRDLCDKYGVSFSILQKKATKEKWTELRSQTRVKAESKIVESVAQQEANSVELIDQAADKLLAKTIEMMSNVEVMSSPSNVRHLSMVLKDIKEIKGYKTELDRQEQMARIEKLRREAQQEEKQDREIKVVIANEVGEYCE